MVFVPVPTIRRRAGIAAACGVLIALSSAAVAPTAIADVAGPADGERITAPVASATSPTGRWFVSLDDGAAAPGGATLPAQAASAVAEFVDEVAALPADVARDVEITATHDELWTGAVIEAGPDAIAEVAALDGVTSVHPVLTTQIPAQVEVAPGPAPEGTAPAALDDTSALEETAAHGEGTAPTALTGKGVRVAVIDTGIDLDHPSFGGSGVNGTTRFPNSVIVGGWDFVGDTYNMNPALGAGFDGVPRPDSRPDDCNGHGTHVAGLLAARASSYVRAGVAPGAELLAYRVFGCTGFTSADIVMDAMETAARDGADVVNFSAAFVGMPWPDYPTAVAAKRLSDSGVLVVAAQGNDPSRSPGLFSTGAPGVATAVLSVGAGTRNAVDDYSVTGPSAVLDVKPDIITEGRSLHSTYPLEKGGAGTATGTSSAAPRIAGLAARLIEQLPSASVAELSARIIGTATPVGSPGSYAPVPRQGGGHVDVQSGAAVSTNLTVTPSRISLGESSGGTRAVELTVTNHAGTSVTVQASHAAAQALGGSPDSPGTVTADATLAGNPSVSIPARSSRTLRLSVEPPTGVAGTLYGGFILLSGSGQRVNVPYLGMIGDFTDLPLFSRDVTTQPTLARVTSCGYAVGPDCVDAAAVRTYIAGGGAEFTLQGTDVPNVVLVFDYPPATLRIEALRVGADGSLNALARGVAPHVDNGGLGRSPDGGFTAWTWDGTYRTAVTAPYTRPDGTVRADLSEALQVPDGTYRLRVTATRALATAGNPRDVETWTSPPFRIRAAVTPPNQWHLATALGGQADLVFRFGAPTDADVYVGNWDGKGSDGIAVRRGNTFYLRNDLSTGTSERAVAYGKPGDTVYVGDWDGNGTDTFAVRRGNTFYLSNDFAGGEAAIVTSYGHDTDEVVIGDWNRDGRDTPSVRRGNHYYMKNTFDGGNADFVQAFGRSDDVVLPGDFDGDGIDSLMVRRGNEYHVKNGFTGGPADRVFTFGRPADTTIVGDWTNAGRDTLGVHRPG